ncbi:hypothetical protein [Actinomadura soli]|uniref:hypothetical protein n=1 Tax=Actinomadura soli TaxID=2508997 RepID=UPI001E5FB763|nr:hypothetical protein [Actinomadura soli]
MLIWQVLRASAGSAVPPVSARMAFRARLKLVRSSAKWRSTVSYEQPEPLMVRNSMAISPGGGSAAAAVEIRAGSTNAALMVASAVRPVSVMTGLSGRARCRAQVMGHFFQMNS